MAGATNAAVPTLIGSVQRALRLLEAAGAHEGGAPAKQLAREAGIPLPTAYHLLRTLTHEDYLRRDKGVFTLGDAIGRLAGSGRVRGRRSTVEDSLTHWRDAFDVAVYLAVHREGGMRDRAALLERPESPVPGEPLVERQEYAMGTVCAAIPITAGDMAGTMAVSLPVHQEARLGPAVEQLQAGIGSLLASLAFSISI